MGMTAIEKILARAGGRDKVSPGDLVVVKVHTAVLFDNNFIPFIWRDVLEVFDAARIVVVFDQRVPAKNMAAPWRTRPGANSSRSSASNGSMTWVQIRG